VTARTSSLLGKKAVRALGVAESFVLDYPRSVLCGIVYRSDGVVDGVYLDFTTVGGDDATEAIARLVRASRRLDIHVVLLDGCILSWYNIVDLARLYEEVKIPVIALAFEEIEGDVESAIRRVFSPEVAEHKIDLFKRLPQPIRLETPYGPVYARVVGLPESPKLIRTILSRFTREGKRPEPIRIAKLVANAVLNKVVRQLQLPQLVSQQPSLLDHQSQV